MSLFQPANMSKKFCFRSLLERAGSHYTVTVQAEPQLCKRCPGFLGLMVWGLGSQMPFQSVGYIDKTYNLLTEKCSTFCVRGKWRNRTLFLVIISVTDSQFVPVRDGKRRYPDGIPPAPAGRRNKNNRLARLVVQERKTTTFTGVGVGGE